MPNILIVEDEDINIALLRSHFSRLDGYAIAGEARNGEEAVRLAAETSPDLILMDITMPGQMNGIEAARTILSQRDVPIIFLTSHADNETMRKATELSPYGYILKPVRQSGLKVAIDIALDRKAIEKRLFSSEARYKAVVEDQVELICRYLPDGALTFVNEAFCRYFETSKDAVIGQQIQEVISQFELDLGLEQENRERETEIKGRDGASKWLQWVDRAICDENGNLIEYQSVAIDISKRKKAEQRLYEYQTNLERIIEEKTADLIKARDEAESANRAKSEFLANVSHELRTPMHQIMNYANFGVSRYETLDREKLREYYSKIITSGQRLMDFFIDLIDLSTMEAGKMKYDMGRYDVGWILSQLMTDLSEQIKSKSIYVEMMDPEVETTISCDHIRIEQVFRKLINNAIKYTPIGKKITLSFEETTLVKEDKTMAALRVSVTDQGVGIPESELDTIFDKFSQSSRTKTGAGGRGLGLAICHEIIKTHAGTIIAENSPGGGAVFKVTLPYQLD